MLLPDFHIIPFVERIGNDLASAMGITALFYSILKKTLFLEGKPRTPFLKKNQF
jgi:hypothetical protein